MAFLFEHFKKETIVSFLTGTQVSLCAHKKVVWAEPDQVVFAHLNVRLVNIHWLEDNGVLGSTYVFIMEVRP